MPFDVDSSEYTFPAPVKILMLVGQYTNPENRIDTKKDEELISNLRSAENEIVPVTSIEQVIDALDKNKFDILIFSGHSETLDDGTDTVIWVTDDVTFHISDIRIQIGNALSRQSHPLVLAIFNSCNGLGIGHRLARLNISIPYLIAMKARIPDEIAPRFLELFLRYFVNERRDFEIAYQQAQESLRPHNLHGDLLPILCTQKNIMPDLFWPDNDDNIMVDNDKLWIKTFISKLWRKKITRYIGLAIITILMIVLGYKLFDSNKGKKIPDPPKILESSVFCKQNNQDISKDHISCGEKSLFDQSNLSNEKMLGIEAFKNKKYDEAEGLLKTAFVQDQKNYETGIFLENAKVLKEEAAKDNLQIFAVAVVIPTVDANNPQKALYSISQAILQGVYNQQQYFNENNKKNKLLVLIVNDNNKSNNKKTGQLGIATQVAKELVQKNIYAIIGPYSSQIAMEIKDIYKNNNIVVMSYANTATKITPQGVPFELKGSFFFRVCSNNQGIAKVLADKLKEQNYNKLTLFLKNDDIFSQSFGNELEQYWENLKNQIIRPAAFMEAITYSDIDARLQDAQSQKIGIILCPGAYTTNQTKYVETTKYILEKYSKQLLIGGCNVVTTYEDAIHKGKNHKNIVVGVPWFYDPKNTNSEFKKWEETWKKQNINFQTDSFMRMVLAQDATMVLTEALTEVTRQKGKPSGIELQRYLANPNNKFQGVTGEISFRGSDRTIDTSKVITPKCKLQQCKNWNGEWEIVY